MKEKVIIIGAGPAGLTMAYELLKDGGNEKYDIEILEATQNIGGISKTVKYHDNCMDIGGHRFFSKDERVIKIWKEIMPIQGEDSFDDKKLGREKKLAKDGPNPETEDDVMLIRQRISRIYYKKKFFDYPITLNFNTIKNIGFCQTIKIGCSYLKSVLIKKEESSLEKFYINRFGKALYNMFFEKYTEKLLGKHPKEISAEWGEQRVKGISIAVIIKDIINKTFGRKNIDNTETSLIEEFWYPKYGPGQLWEKLASIVEEKGAKINKGYYVKNINFRNGKIISVDCVIKKKIVTVKGDIFVSSMPIDELIKGFSGINVPDKIQKIAEGLEFRSFITVGVLVDKLEIENKTKIRTLGNIIPDCWIYVQEPDIKMCRMQIFNNWSPYLVKDVENKVWIGLEYTCEEGDKYWKMPDKKIAEFAINELVSMNIINKKQVEDIYCERMRKVYPVYAGTYKDIGKVKEFLNKIDNLYYIGRNGQHRYNNMDHSMITAIEEANKIRAMCKQ